MKFLFNFFKKNWAILVVLIAGILASRTLLFQKGYFNMHDDLQMMRQLQMEKCFHDFQIPCRWVPDMGYEYGFPLFNFYPPLPYLVGQIVRLFSFSFMDTAKILFAISLISSGITMYFLVKAVVKNELSALLSSIFYIWAPYHAVDVYVRGAMNESWALIFFPLILLFGYKLVENSEDRVKNQIYLALSWAGLLMSHNLMVMIFGPVFALWILLLFYLNKFKNLILIVKSLIFSGLLSLGLSAYFTFPAIFENNLTWLKSQLVGYYDYTAHFVTLYQLLISRFWGYGPSTWLEEDGMPFPAGHIHWILSLIIIALTLYAFFTNKKKKIINQKMLLTILFLFLVGWFAAFMTHVRSTFVYQSLTFIALVQFPWRFLTIVIFMFSFLSGYLILFLSKKYQSLVFILLSLFVVVFNWNFFLPEHGRMGKLTDQEKLSGEAWRLQTTAGIMDYLPLTAKENPRDGKKVLVEVINQDGDKSADQSLLLNFKQGTDWAEFSVDSNKEIIARINIFKFPNWKVYIDEKEVQSYIPEKEKWGRMWIDLPQGKYNVHVRFENTTVRTISNYISLFSWLGLIVFVMIQFRSARRKINNRINKGKVS